MADNFGLKIGLEGEREFKKALAEINSQFKVLGSEMKLVDSAFDKNSTSIESLTAKNGVLTKEIEAQRKKVETLERALQNASDSFGENDRRTQSWQIQLNNAKATLNNMERELKENTEAIEQHGKAMSDAADDADDLSDSLEDSGDKAEDAVLHLFEVIVRLGCADNCAAHAHRMNDHGGTWHYKRIVCGHRHGNTDGMAASKDKGNCWHTKRSDHFCNGKSGFHIPAHCI